MAVQGCRNEIFLCMPADFRNVKGNCIPNWLSNNMVVQNLWLKIETATSWLDNKCPETKVLGTNALQPKF